MRLVSPRSNFSFVSQDITYVPYTPGVLWGTRTTVISGTQDATLISSSPSYDSVNNVLYYIARSNEYYFAPATALLFKVNATTGSIIWKKNLPFDITTTQTAGVDSSGNVFVVGSYYVGGDRSAGDDTIDIFVMKMTAAGAVSWTRRLTGPSAMPDYVYTATVDPSGGVAIGGYVYNGTPTGYTQWYLARYDTNGTATINKRVGASTAYSSCRTVLADASSNIIGVGNTTSTFNDYNIDIIRQSSSGTVDIQKRLTLSTGASKYLQMNNAVIDSAGNLYVAFVHAKAASTYYASLVKINAGLASVAWVKVFPNQSGTGSVSAFVTYGSDGYIYFHGTVAGVTNLYKMDTSGTIVLSRRITNTSSYPYSGPVFSNGDIIFSYSGSSPNGSANVMRFRALGSFQPELGTYNFSYGTTNTNFTVSTATVESTANVTSDFTYANYTNTITNNPLTSSTLSVSVSDSTNDTTYTFADKYIS